MTPMKPQSAEQPLFRTVRGTNFQGAAVALHAHDEAQLIFAASGTMQVYTAGGSWLVPPQLAVWVPAGVTHRIDIPVRRRPLDDLLGSFGIAGVGACKIP
jgi:mannose-6-phosphate isomerase-like protein (cupin superfamily)